MKSPLLVRIVLVGAVWAMLGGATSAHATESTDLTVGLKTLPLLNNKLSGDVATAIVYDAAVPDSKADADAIKATIDGGLSVPGGATLTASLVSVGELSKLAGSKIVFVAKGLSAGGFDAVSAASASAGALSISADLACVRANKCVLGVVSKPSVEIYFSKAAADSAKIGFAQAFTMLAKQI